MDIFKFTLRIVFLFFPALLCGIGSYMMFMPNTQVYATMSHKGNADECIYAYTVKDEQYTMDGPCDPIVENGEFTSICYNNMKHSVSSLKCVPSFGLGVAFFVIGVIGSLLFLIVEIRLWRKREENTVTPMTTQLTVVVPVTDVTNVTVDCKMAECANFEAVNLGVDVDGKYVVVENISSER